MKIKTNIRTLLILALVVLLGSNQNIAQNVGIGSTSFTPDASSVLELQSVTQGFLPPRLTTEQRDLIQNPAEGLLIFNTTTKCIEYYAYDFWQSYNCAECPVPAIPNASTHVASDEQITWNWNSVAGATGYKWHTTNNYDDASDLGNTTTVTQDELICNTSYTIYVWAYNACGNSTVLTLNQITSACPGPCDVPSVTFTYKGEQVTYGTVESSGRCWLDRNLGATQVATGSTDHLAYGDLFQWGRAADGHQLITWSCGDQNNCGNPINGITTTLSNSDTPTHSNFILGEYDPWDWRNPQNHNLWQGVNGNNNPCPSGWRIPTEAEWNVELQSMAPNLNATGAINSPLKLPLAGYRNSVFGSLHNVGSQGHYWSSSVEGNRSKLVLFRWNTLIYGDLRGHGFSVRCIKD
jgi:uncharacterized protein (TIGR02145 family)